MEEIRLTSSDSLLSTDMEQSVDVELQHTTKKYMITDIKSVVDAYDVYRKESSECNRYRLTLTINPFCTNVLFNTCTEVILNDGAYTDSNQSHDQIKVYKDNNTYTIPAGVSQDKICGKTSNLTRSYMVENTEYSSEEIGITYYPGYDIFDNHILRNLSFRSVIPLDGTQSQSERSLYNTISDIMRNIDGSPVMFSPRMEYGETDMKEKHLYDIGNTLSMKEGESVSVNLTNQNGWYGFYNNSSITPKMINGNTTIEHDDSHVINNKGNCDFVDMYPDRTLFLFNPKRNPYKRRLEKNWDIHITYPYSNFYKHNLVTNTYEEGDGTVTMADGMTNGLFIIEARYQQTRNGIKGVQFRTPCKHNLSQNDDIIIYYSIDNTGQNIAHTYKACENVYRVSYIGDMSDNHKDYYFTINGDSIVSDIFAEIIENVFYNYSATPPNPYRVMNGDFDEIPNNLNNKDGDYIANVKRFYYDKEVTEPINVIWDETNTFDEIPLNVMQSPQYIRVREKNNNSYVYDYYQFDGEQYVLLNLPSDYEKESFGTGNTFDDVPSYYITEYIRVHTYTFYKQKTRFYTQKDDDIETLINETLKNRIYLRFAKVHNGVKCDYYFRKFKKLPNLKYAKEILTASIGKDKSAFEKYVQENATDSGVMIGFDNEAYPLAFSNTIYGDSITQEQFLDNIDVSNIRDNMGRPVTDIYATIVKRNTGYKEWYLNGKYSDFKDIFGVEHKVEYSHCFGKVTSGLDFMANSKDNSVIRKHKRKLSDASNLTNVDNVESSIPLEEFDNVNMSNGKTNGILETDDEFFGDVVEYDFITANETVLCDVNFRFNTAQRENGNIDDYVFTTHDIIADDYTPGGEFYVEVEHGGRDVICPEGYMYKAHYKIPVRTFGGDIKQASHHTMRVVSASPVQMGGIFIRLELVSKHTFGEGHKVFICDDRNKIWYETFITNVDTPTSFLINPIPKDITSHTGQPYIDWVETCKMINNGLLNIRLENYAIPDYAKNVGTNAFLWRDVLQASESEDEEVSSYPFANNSLYIDKRINFFLRRQDPENLNGLYYNGNTSTGRYPDVQGKTIVESNYEYVPQIDVLC